MNKPLIGGLIDRKYATGNSLPERVVVFSYRSNASSSNINISFENSIKSKDLFTPEYGYYSATLRTMTDFLDFAQHVDDIVMVQWTGNNLVMGGRKYQQGSRRSLTMEEIAALYQAYNAQNDHFNQKKYESFVRIKYSDMLRKDNKLRKAVQLGTVKESQLLEKIRQQFPPVSARKQDVNVGFSLDPARDYPALADDIARFARELSDAGKSHDTSNAAIVSSRSKELVDVAKRLKTRKDVVPLLSLIRRYARSGNMTDMGISNMLQNIEARHSYQTARYDGRLQGTSTGTILFYTDLLAKLWALDYNGIAPKTSIKGFRSMLETSVPKLYWDDFERHSQTRLWFGLRQEGFELYGNKVLFQPAATRVYAASSDPLAPGKEGSPNYQSKEFLGWWDKHYESVADHEQYYHKLNQVQKWSCVFMVLKEKRSHHLDYLLTVPITRNIDFEGWLKNNVSLPSALNIPFLDKHKYGQTTECLPLLRSRNYPLMGKNFMLSGGVSLASRKDILAKLHKNDKGALSPSGLPIKDRTSSPISENNANKPSSVGRASDVASTRHAQTSRPQKSRTLSNVKPELSGSEQAVSSDTMRRISRGDYGTFSAEKQVGVIRLKWDKGSSVAADDLVASLAALQQSNARTNKGETIFRGVSDIQSVVRVKEWQSYLIKTVSTKNEWIYLNINPSKNEEYPSKASAATPEADIFCARLVSDDIAKKLAAGNLVIIK